MGRVALLLQPVKAVAMSAAVDDVCFAIAIHVVTDNREPGFLQIPIAVPLPLVAIGVDILEPAVRRQKIHFAVAIDVRHADAVAILVMAAHVVDLRLGASEVHPNDSRAAVVRQRQIRLTVAIEVRHPAALGLDRVGDEVALPHDSRFFRVLVPKQPIRHPACRHHVRRAIVIHVHYPLAAVGHKFSDDIDGAVLVALPLAALRPRILVPIRPAQDIRPPVAVHVQGGDALGVIGAQSMDGISGFRHIAGRVAPHLIQLSVGGARQRGRGQRGQARQKKMPHRKSTLTEECSR